MFEIALAIAGCGAIGKIADAEGRSMILWGTITLVLCAASFAIPVPFARVLLAVVVTFVFMMIAKARGGR